MEKQKRWQLWLIIAVIAITFYNILPTLFYYSKPLKEAISPSKAQEISTEIISRVQSLEKDSLDWVKNYCNYLQLQPTSIHFEEKNLDQIKVAFKTEQEAAKFKYFVAQAGQAIPFAPSRLRVITTQEHAAEVALTTSVNGIDLKNKNQILAYSPKYTSDRSIAKPYVEFGQKRAQAVLEVLTRESSLMLQLQQGASNKEQNQAHTLLEICKNFENYTHVLKDHAIAQRLCGYTILTSSNTKNAIWLTKELQQTITQLQKQQASLKQKREKLKEKGEFLPQEEQSYLDELSKHLKTLQHGLKILQKWKSSFEKQHAQLGKLPLLDKKSPIDLSALHPFVSSVAIDWSRDAIVLKLQSDVQNLMQKSSGSEAEQYTATQLNSWMMSEFAKISQITGEEINTSQGECIIPLSHLASCESFLTLDLSTIAKNYADNTLNTINTLWKPTHADLVSANFPVLDYTEYQKLTSLEQALGLFIYTPVVHASPEKSSGFAKDSLYVVVRGFDQLRNKAAQHPDAPETQQLAKDFQNLHQLLESTGFFVVQNMELFGEQYAQDIIYEYNSFYSPFIQATRENFKVYPLVPAVVLELSTVEHRIGVLNKIETMIHEDLLKERDQFNAAKVSINPQETYLYAPPVKNVYWQNLLLSARKYVRGDERKTLKWGLDLSGGKIIHLSLRDQNQSLITQLSDLERAKNELNLRLNKMGVSEVNIRIEGTGIVVEFPGSQQISASELIKSSAMYFHIVNEEFGLRNKSLAELSNRFLESVWHEAIVTNRKDSASINEIAYRRLMAHENDLLPESDVAQSDAKILYDAGLRFSAPDSNEEVSNDFNDSISMISRFKGESISEWHGQTHPLLIVFRNYALEGYNLENVQAVYDPSEGNFLVFGVKKYSERGGNPQEDLHRWTSQFAKDKIQESSYADIIQDDGWRMAVILNGHTISYPVLKSALKDRGSISGNFSQREVSQLATDLRAGSLSFTPHILSEVNVAPDLGTKERAKGIIASLIGLILLVNAMCIYYRFAGVVASIAVLFNLLIMWGILQNLGAAVTLPGIAGIILTLGMAVDANVLVFERFREEFKLTGRLASAMNAAYKKAFTAIFDSNITTIIAAFILMQFDSGPIKGFAVTLIVGIISSMFTALFMTKYFFAGWVYQTQNKNLPMSDWFTNLQFSFLKRAKLVVILAAVIVIGGFSCFFSNTQSIFGMDFTGGYALNLQVQSNNSISPRDAVIHALESKGISRGDIHVRTLNQANHLRIELSKHLDEEQGVFFGLPQEKVGDANTYLYQNNPRITWVINSLQEHGITVAPETLPVVHQYWNAMSSQLSDVMKNQALLSLAISLAAILVYITIRFEFNYAMSAIIGLIHDLLVTVAILAIGYTLGLPIKLDMNVVAALMTIVGYSLNDTIIVFDRVREDRVTMRKLPLTSIVTHALNTTLSRTLLTTGTTLLVLVALVLFGGESIFTFAFTMSLGVIVGTISSLFIVSPALIYLEKSQIAKKIS